MYIPGPKIKIRYYCPQNDPKNGNKPINSYSY